MVNHHKYLAILNVYAPAKKLNLHEDKFIELKGQINKSTVVIIGDVNSSQQQLDRTTRKKTSKDIKELSNNINQ